MRRAKYKYKISLWRYITKAFTEHFLQGNDHWHRTGLSSVGAIISTTLGQGRKRGTLICIISGRGRKTVGASGSAPLEMIHIGPNLWKTSIYILVEICLLYEVNYWAHSNINHLLQQMLSALWYNWIDFFSFLLYCHILFWITHPTK